jgi:cysteine-rich repeat protein
MRPILLFMGLTLLLPSCFGGEVDLTRSSIRCAVDDECPVDSRCRAARCVSRDLPERCGDGIIDVDEECDDGNGDPTDACAACRVARCGDGIVRADVEECDDGNSDDADACLTTCRSNVCGDGIRNPAREACDDGNDNDEDACRTSCILNTCGDGVVLIGVEACDDGNDSDEDACLQRCEANVCGDGRINVGVEACDNGAANAVDADCLPGCVASRCGDGFRNARLEACDDGNAVDEDACRTDCSLNVCGDGIVNPLRELCDDGDADDTDGCTSDCTLPSCGDGIVQAGEGCDDGNDSDNDACLRTCVPAACGDGFVRFGIETCDDGNTSNLDGCLDSCVPNVCGDGFHFIGVEGCDDGNRSDEDACLNDCVANVCGDGRVAVGIEQCDLGAANAITGTCLPTCLFNVCGDGFVDALEEECDDGSDNGDDRACLSSCVRNVCGDGQRHLGIEICDDGNTDSGDGCDSTCSKIEVCGDGVVDVGEACDDGNANPRDGCDRCGAQRFDAIVRLGASGAGVGGAQPGAITVDGPTIFIGDRCRVLRADTGNFDDIRVVAGGERCGVAGDGGLALAAQLEAVVDLAVDELDRLLIMTSDGRVRRVEPTTGTIETIAGTGVIGASGDGGLATSAQLIPGPIVADGGAAFLVFAGRAVRRVADDGRISTVANCPFAVTGASRRRAPPHNVLLSSAAGPMELLREFGLCTDIQGTEPLLDVLETSDGRRIDVTSNPLRPLRINFSGIAQVPSGAIAIARIEEAGQQLIATTVAGDALLALRIEETGALGDFFVTGTGLLPSTLTPRQRSIPGLVAASFDELHDGFLVSDGERLLTVPRDGRAPLDFGTLAENAADAGITDNIGRVVSLAFGISPFGDQSLLARDDRGTLWQIHRNSPGLVGEARPTTETFELRPIDGEGGLWQNVGSRLVRTIPQVGDIAFDVIRASSAGDDAPLESVTLASVSALGAGDNGSILVVEQTSPPRVRQIDLVDPVTGVGPMVSTVLGPMIPEAFSSGTVPTPTGVVATNGDALLVTGGGGRVYSATNDGAGIVIGRAFEPPADGPAFAVRPFNAPAGMAIVDDGTALFVADRRAPLRVVRGQVRDVTSATSWTVEETDIPPASDVAIHGGLLFTAHPDEHCVRAFAHATGFPFVRTVIGRCGIAGTSSPGVPTTMALRAPESVAIDDSGRVLVADTGNNRVLLVDGAAVRLLLGDGSPSNAGEGAPTAAFPVNRPRGIAIDADGNVAIAANDAVRLLVANGPGALPRQVLTIFGRAPRTSFPDTEASCLVDVTATARGFSAVDACANLVIDLVSR